MNHLPSLVALVGGDEFSSHCLEMDTRILSLIKPLSGNPKVAIIPTAAASQRPYLTGGDPNHLVNVLRDSIILSLIGTLATQGCFIAGSSAGAMVLGKQMFYRGVTAGLSLIGDIITLPHHENSDPASIHESIVSLLPKKSKTYGIDGGTGLIFTDSGTEILGRGTVTSYNQHGWAVSKSKQLP